MITTLTAADWPRLKPLLDANPAETIFLSSRIERYGLDAAQLGCPVIGVVRGGDLVAAVHYGANLMAVGDVGSLGEVIERIGPRSRTMSILGPAATVHALYTGLVQRWGNSWAQVRDMRAHQPLMVWHRSDPLGVAPDPRVVAVGMDQFEAYFRAAVSMYTEEVGVTPLDPSDSYRYYVRYLVQNRRAFGASSNGHVWFKADVGADYEAVCQLQGVWLDPALRGKGLSEPLMAAVMWLLDAQWTTVSLYVNDFNMRARHMYQRLGFLEVGELATVLY